MAEQISRIGPVGLHHTILGSFRMIPRYEKLGIPYTVGPLGGGEYIPAHLLDSLGFPFTVWLEERFRPVINHACVGNPLVKPTLQGAAAVLATTDQTADLLSRVPCRNVATVFPDVFDSLPEAQGIIEKRRIQATAGLSPIRLLFSGRALWWKGGHVALRLAKALSNRGVPYELRLITGGQARSAWEKIASDLGIADNVIWQNLVSREELLAMQLQAHAFLYPSLHDSSSSAIPEAYSRGLPSLTLGIGGVGCASSPLAGLNRCYSTLETWLEAATDKIVDWQKNPDSWLADSMAALEHSKQFSIRSIENAVEKFLLPFLK